MKLNNIENIEELFEKLNYRFKDITFLENALKHSSYQNEHSENKNKNNQRMEFLGDSVLELAITEELFLKNNDLMEGQLSKLRSKVVSKSALFKIAQSLNLGQYMLFGKGEYKQNAQYKPSILADAVEALFGAIFLDGGYDESKRVILNLCSSAIDEAYNGKINTDYKSLLQEVAQKVKGRKVEYEFDSEEGPEHNRIFYYKVIYDGKVISTGMGKSKKKAQQNGAKNALIKLGELNE